MKWFSLLEKKTSLLSLNPCILPDLISLLCKRTICIFDPKDLYETYRHLMFLHCRVNHGMFIHGILRQLSSTMWNNPKNILK
jgi:hypothetical protein